ncbi:conserved hypothetical protein [Verticillium alfalfae VaMs.102]|uniref:Major facilitator superfamily (MFS) profile domain-containing protein n=1 Tax=Verticillium alfalfae (strain VaMs.102 / ATCC MYA-4576 / FGSC 10136) TaxID=526221 RepID=C9SB59_VERA1|nr:conserved hypothetical protein [Verticillium alfalfae VaMs.102]EEY15609.1 conserved hypothetical protein [Verticillium alfalfae VaMs.102]
MDVSPSSGEPKTPPPFLGNPEPDADLGQGGKDATSNGSVALSRPEAEADPTPPDIHPPDVATQTRQKVYHTGWKLHALTAGLCLSLLLSTLETTIVSTSLVSIVDHLQGFDRASWIVTSYLLTYTGSWSRSFSELFQGMGGSGIYSLSPIMVSADGPLRPKFATYIAIVTSVFAISSVLGPLLGGAITDNTTWRGPGGALAAALVALAIPFGFPYGDSTTFFRSLISEKRWKRIDLLGATLSLAASILLIFALQQGGVEYAWNSGAIISTFVLSGTLWLAFIAWERKLSGRSGVCEPIFPWRLTSNRFVVGLLLNGFLTGFPFMAAIINIPQRLQTVNSTTAIGAGLRMLPLLLLSPVASALSGVLITKLKVPPLYVLTLGGVLQVIGVGLFSSLDSTTLRVPDAQYGYQVIMGLGFGFNLATILMMATIIVSEKDLGGTIGLAVCSALLIDHIRSQASAILTPTELASILSSSGNIALLPPEKQYATRVIFAEAYSRQMRVMLYFSLAALGSILFLFEKKPRRAVTTTTVEDPTSRSS